MSTALAVLAASSIALEPLIIAVVVGLLLAILAFVVFNHIAPSYSGMIAAAVFVVCLLIGLLLALD